MSRPVFVPSGKRRTKLQQHQQQQRFHGAFTGGFSAGYFNTVDTKEGWTPKQPETGYQNQQQQKQIQQMEDFMDEQDFNEWGGPTSVKKDFSETIQKPKSLFSLDPPLNVGRRLLRVLGWKEGEAAYVPTNESTRENVKEEDGMAAHLSVRKLKRIKLQRSNLKLPVPKLDTCGLGYDVYLDAPEFQNHREQLRRKAHARTKAVTNKTGSNVYRLSDLNSSCADSDKNIDLDEMHDLYQAHETLQDFVGKTSVGGFALREDDDDVYDSAPLAKSASAVKIDREQYDVEIAEHHSDEEELPKPTDVSDIFSSWAATTTTSRKTSTGSSDRGAMTSDGRALLSGFILGSSRIRQEQERYPGPDVPPDFEMKRHVFAHGPEAFQSESVVDRIIHQAKQAVKTHRENGVMAGATFIGLAEAMKNRFSTPKSVEETFVHPAGLHVPIVPPQNELPVVLVPASISSTPVMKTKRKIKLTRQSMVFAPNPLVYKRFLIRPPIHSVKVNQLETRQGAEATFFKNEIMSKVVGAKTKIKENDEMEETDAPSEGVYRPDLTVHQSIFQPESESSESESDEAKTEVEINPSSLMLPPKPIGVPMPMSEPIDQDAYQQYRTKDERKKRRRRSSSSTDASLSSDDRRKRRKEKKHRKKEKSHHKKSSRRQRKD